MNKAIKSVVWNGCDGYVAAADAARQGYDFDGERLYHGAATFVAFDATAVSGDVDVDSPPEGVFYMVVDGVLYAATDDGSAWEDQ